MPNFLNDKLDANQVIKSVHDLNFNALRVSVVNGSPGGGGEITIAIDAAEDSVAIGDGTNLATITQVGPKNGLDVNVINNPLQVNVSNEVEITNDSGNPIPVNGTVTANLGTLNGAATEAKQDIANSSLTSIDSKLTSPLTVQATDLDVRNLVFATDKVDVSNSTVDLSPTTLSALENVSIDNFPSVYPINDNGGSITVDGTVELGATSLAALENITVTVSNEVEISNDAGNPVPVNGTVELGSTTLAALESVTVQNGAGVSAVNIQDGGNSITVDGSVSTVGQTLNISGTGSALNSTPIPATDVSGYAVASVHIRGTFVATYIFESSNDNVNWVSTIGNLVSVNNVSPVVSNTVTNLIYQIPLTTRFFRVRLSTFTSGTVIADAHLQSESSFNLGQRQISGTVAATQSGTWNVTNVTGTVSLPTGAATSALQTTGNNSLASIDSKLTSPLTVQATDLDIRNLVFATDKVDVSGSSVSVSNFPAVQPINDNGGSLTVDGTVELGSTTLAALENITIDDISNNTSRELGRILASDILFVAETFNTTSATLAQARPVNGDLNIRNYKSKTIFVQNTSVNAGRYSIFASIDNGVNYDIPVVNNAAIAAGVTAVTNTENVYTHLRITARSQTGGQTTTYVTKAYAQGV